VPVRQSLRPRQPKLGRRARSIHAGGNSATASAGTAARRVLLAQGVPAQPDGARSAVVAQAPVRFVSAVGLGGWIDEG